MRTRFGSFSFFEKIWRAENTKLIEQLINSKNKKMLLSLLSKTILKNNFLKYEQQTLIFFVLKNIKNTKIEPIFLCSK